MANFAQDKLGTLAGDKVFSGVSFFDDSMYSITMVCFGAERSCNQEFSPDFTNFRQTLSGAGEQIV